MTQQAASKRTKTTCRRRDWMKALPVLDLLVRNLRALGYPPLGPSFATLGPTELADALVVHRISKRYEIPGEEMDANVRRSAAIAAVVEHDGNAPSFNWRTLNLAHRRTFLKASEKLKTVFRGFKLSYDAHFPTGESARSSGGSPDILHRLSHLEFWEVSLEALPYATTIAYRNPHLKGIVRQKFDEEYGEYSAVIKREWSRLEERDGFRVFSRMFRSLVTINGVSRMTTVPKTSTQDRVITCEPLWNMVCQLSLMHDLRRYYLRRTGIDLRHLQDLHKGLCRNASLATIDLRNASNSVWLPVVRQLWPGRVLRALESVRCTTTEFELDGETCYHHFNMFSPMGCGVTFDVMTLSIWALCSADGFASVFGDDIVVEQGRAPAVIGVLESVGLVVNKDKTFIEGAFRESCGGFSDVRDSSLLVSYDMPRPATLPDLYGMLNKLRCVVEAGQVSQPLAWLLHSAYKECLQWVPSVARAPGRPHVATTHLTGLACEDEGYYDMALQRLVQRYRSLLPNVGEELPVSDRLLQSFRLLYGREHVPRKKPDGDTHPVLCCTTTASRLSPKVHWLRYE